MTAETHKNNMEKNMDKLEQIIKASDNILCMDGFISNRTLKFLERLEIKYSYQEYTKKPEKRFKTKVDNLDIIIKDIIKYIREDKNIVIVSSSKYRANIFYNIIKQYFPNKKIEKYTSDRKNLNDIIKTMGELD